MALWPAVRNGIMQIELESIATGGRCGGTMIIFGIIQVVVFAILSLANFALAYRIYKIQSDRNTAKLVVNGHFIEDDEREASCISVYNVGLVPAVGVSVLIDIEEWKHGKRLDSRFHERCRAFSDHSVSLKPQDHRIYELPTIEDRACVFTAVATCRNGSGDEIRFFTMGNDPEPMAARQVFSRSQKKKGIKALKSQLRPKGGLPTVSTNSLRYYDDLFSDES